LADIKPTGYCPPGLPDLRLRVDGNRPELQREFLGTAPVPRPTDGMCSWCGLSPQLHIIEGQVVTLADWHRRDSGRANGFYLGETPAGVR